MLPNVDGHDGHLTMSNGGVSIVVTLNSKLAVGVYDEPSPARTEVSDSSVLESVESLFDATQVLIHLLGQSGALGCLEATVRGEAVPKEGVVEGLGGVVEKTLVLVLDRVLDDLLDGHLLDSLVLLSELVQLVDVVAVVLVVVVLNLSLRHEGLHVSGLPWELGESEAGSSRAEESNRLRDASEALVGSGDSTRKGLGGTSEGAREHVSKGVRSTREVCGWNAQRPSCQRFGSWEESA